jgi:hypothetical protein
MRTIIALLFAIALGAIIGVRWAYSDGRRWIVRGDQLPY